MRIQLGTIKLWWLPLLLVVAGCTGSPATATPGASTPSSGASRHPLAALTGSFRPIASGEDVQVLDTRFIVRESAPVEVVVTVQNNGAGAIRFGPASAQTFKLVAADGSEVGSGLLMPMYPYVDAGQKGYLGGWVSDLAAADTARIDHVVASITFQAVASFVAPVLTVKAPMAQVDDTTGKLVVRGRLENTASTTNENGVVCVLLLDADLNPIGWLRDDHTVPGLGAGQNVIFTADSPDLPASMLSSVFVSWASAYDAYL